MIDILTNNEQYILFFLLFIFVLIYAVSKLNYNRKLENGSVMATPPLFFENCHSRKTRTITESIYKGPYPEAK